MSSRPEATRSHPTSALVGVGLGPQARETLLAAEVPAELVEVETTEEALALLAERAFRAIVLDAQRVRHSDLDRLRAAAPASPLVIVGPEEAAAELAGFAEGYSFEFLRQSLSREALSQRLRKILLPRQSPRLDLRGRALEVRGVVEGSRFSHPAVDLSHRGLSFEVPLADRPERFFAANPVSDIELVDGERVLLRQAAASIRRTRVVGEEPVLQVGLAFEAPPRSPAQTLNVLREPVQIVAALTKAERAEAKVSLERADDPNPVKLHIAAIDAKEGTLVLQGPLEAPFDPPEALRLTFDITGRSHSGLCVLVSKSPPVVRLPQSLRVEHRRGSYRQVPPADRVGLVHLRSKLTGVDGRYGLVDLNATGLSVHVGDAGALLPPGLVLDELEIETPEGPVRLVGTVRSSTLMSRGGRRYGIEITADGLARHALERLLVGASHANVAIAGPEDAGTIRALFGQAGHRFHLYADGSEASESAVAQSFSALLGPRSEVSTSIVYVEGGAILGHIQGLRTYDRAWLATHLAAMTRHAGDLELVSRALCRVLAGLLEGKATADFVKFIWKKDQKSVNRLFGWTGRALDRSPLSEAGELGLFLRPNGPLPPRDDAIETREAADDELPWVAAQLARTHSILAILSEDLTAKGLRLTRLGRDYAAVGLERGRRVRLAIAGGRFLGAALVETSTKAVQINEFLNHASFHPFVDGRLADEVRFALALDAASSAYERGLTHAVALGEPAARPALERAGFSWVADLRFRTLHRSLFRPLMDAWEVLYRQHGDLCRRGGDEA